MDHKSVCMIDGVWVSKRKWKESKERLAPRWKKMRLEVESELELDGSREDGWRAWGLHDITFGLLGLQSNLEERNHLLREQNGYLQRIAMCLERTGLGPELDSTMRE